MKHVHHTNKPWTRARPERVAMSLCVEEAIPQHCALTTQPSGCTHDERTGGHRGSLAPDSEVSHDSPLNVLTTLLMNSVLHPASLSMLIRTGGANTAMACCDWERWWPCQCSALTRRSRAPSTCCGMCCSGMHGVYVYKCVNATFEVL